MIFDFELATKILTGSWTFENFILSEKIGEKFFLYKEGSSNGRTHDISRGWS